MKNDRKHSDRRVVITGLGVVSSLGIGWSEFWESLLAGKSGISLVERFDTSAYDCHRGGEVKNFDPKTFISRHRIKKIGKASQMAIAASKLALEDAQVKTESLKKETVSVNLGTTAGECNLLESFNDLKFNHKRDMVDNHYHLGFPSNILSSNVAMDLKVNGPNCVFTTACASGNYAISRAFDQIRLSKVNYALAGGTDAFSRIVFTGFGRIFSIAKEKCQPFDKDRTGMIPAEGAGMLFLESLESAQRRGAHVYAEVLGYGLSCDAHHMTNPSIEGIAKAIKKAIVNSGVDIDCVDYISAHGTGTRENDKVESLAINKVFGRRTLDIPVSSIKSMLGHAMGAASAFEAITCCLVIKYGKIPPTINYKTKDPDCNVYCVPNKSIERRVEIALNNSQAFGGNNACLVLRKAGVV